MSTNLRAEMEERAAKRQRKLDEYDEIQRKVAQLEREELERTDVRFIDPDTLCLTYDQMTTSRGTTNIVNVYVVPTMKGRDRPDRILTKKQVEDLDKNNKNSYFMFRHGVSNFSSLTVNENQCGTYPPKKDSSDPNKKLIPAQPSEAKYEACIGPCKPCDYVRKMDPAWREKWTETRNALIRIETELHHLTFHVPGLADKFRVEAFADAIYMLSRTEDPDDLQLARPLLDAIAERDNQIKESNKKKKKTGQQNEDLIGNRAKSPSDLVNFVRQCSAYTSSEELRARILQLEEEEFVAGARSCIIPVKDKGAKSVECLSVDSDEPEQWRIRVTRRTHVQDRPLTEDQIRNYLGAKQGILPEAVNSAEVAAAKETKMRLSDTVGTLVNTKWHVDKCVFQPCPILARINENVYVNLTHNMCTGKYERQNYRAVTVLEPEDSTRTFDLAERLRGRRYGIINNGDTLSVRTRIGYHVGSDVRQLEFQLITVLRIMEHAWTPAVVQDTSHTNWGSGLASETQLVETLAETKARIQRELDAMDEEDAKADVEMEAALRAAEEKKKKKEEERDAIAAAANVE